MKKKLPKTLDELLYKIHKSIWEIGEITPIKLKVYDIVTSIAEKSKYEVSQHREYVDVYKFVLKEENRK